MNSASTHLHVYERAATTLPAILSNGQRAAVSLHCHTNFSKELLSFIPHYAAMIPVVSKLFKAEMDRYLTLHGRTVDFANAYWTPPVSPRQVLEIEMIQIESRLGLPALVSITDHDDIEASSRLQVIDSGRRIPISLEWTVPYRNGFFHLGVHNLPQEFAQEIYRELMKYSNQTDDTMALGDLLALLDEAPETLVVLNHPLWDIEFIGADQHRACLRTFLAEHRQHLHAFEINGFRSWRENNATIRLAEDWGIPVVSGGDRHGCQANTLLNLTRSNSFADFVAEIREDNHSEVLLMPEYTESLVARTIQVAADVLRQYPNHPLGQPCWNDRVFVDLGDGLGSCPLTRHWPNGGPAWVRASLWMLRMLGTRLQPALRMALAGEKVAANVVAERMGYEN
ncbi:MAG: hypothetical protein JST85_24055 [Acidobacteria bacterium]|nr:hypothetical protein [Acidobacteriota bacterium]